MGKKEDQSKEKEERTISKLSGKNVQENSNEEMETTMLKEMESSKVNDKEMFDF